MKIVRYFFYITLSILVLILPIYGAARLLLPDYLRNRIIENLPNGSTISIGAISSKSNLGLIFENISFQSNDKSLILKSPKLELLPQFSLKKPLKIIADDFFIRLPNISGNLKKLNLDILFENIDQNKFSLLGEINSIENSKFLSFSGLEFFLDGINSNSTKVNVKVDDFFLVFENQFGRFNFKGKNLKSESELSDKISFVSDFKDLEVIIGEPVTSDSQKKILAKEIAMNLDLYQSKNWQALLNFNLNSITSNQTNLAETISISSLANWSESNSDCSYTDLLSKKKECGFLRDFINNKVSVYDSMGGKLSILGDGICVTPNAGCLQRINAEIKTKKTTQVLTPLITSGVINPLLGGVLISGLLSSPYEVDANYDHKIKMNVTGSKILINDKPLL